MKCRVNNPGHCIDCGPAWLKEPRNTGDALDYWKERALMAEDRMPDKRPPKAWAATWKRAARRYREAALDWECIAGLQRRRLKELRQALAYLESRVDDYPILGQLLKQAKEQ